MVGGGSGVCGGRKWAGPRMVTNTLAPLQVTPPIFLPSLPPLSLSFLHLLPPPSSLFPPLAMDTDLVHLALLWFRQVWRRESV